jgi:hypothetical protein
MYDEGKLSEWILSNAHKNPNTRKRRMSTLHILLSALPYPLLYSHFVQLKDIFYSNNFL